MQELERNAVESGNPFPHCLSHLCSRFLAPLPRTGSRSPHPLDMAKARSAREELKEETRAGKFVPKWEYWAKAKLASYVSEDGVPFHVGQGQDEKKFLKLDSIRGARDSKNEELYHRLGMGLTLDAASIDAGFKLLSKHFAGTWPDAVSQVMSKTGLPQVKEFLNTEKGQAFAEAMSILNVGRTGQPEERDVKRAVKTLVTFATEGTDDLVKHLGRLASCTATLYLCSMTLLKDLALFDDLEAWAKNMQGKQSSTVKSWTKRPGNKDKLRAALLAELMMKIGKNRKDSTKKRKASESSAPGDVPAAASALDQSSSTSTSKAKKSKKDKKSKKKSSKSSGTAGSTATSKTSDKKTKKATAKKDKKSKDVKAKDNKAKKKKKKSKDGSSSSRKANKGGSSKGDKPGSAPPAEVSEADRITAAFTAWRQGDIQICGAAVATEKTRVGDLPGGFVEKPVLDELIGQVPEAVRACFPALLQLQGQIEQHEQVPNTLARKVLARLTAITSEAEAFWEDQTGAGAASAAE